MARSHAKILVQVWRDRDWTDLSRDAHWLYWLLLTQPKLTLVGSLEVTPGRWANLAAGTTREDVEAALGELRAARKVLVDDTTDELLIRTFTTHDLDPNRVNVNLAKGLWGQWGCIASDALRRIAVTLIPDSVWEKLEPHAPSDATYIRRSARLEPGEWLRSQPGAPPRFEPPPSSLLPPDDSNRPADTPPQAPPVENPIALGLEARCASIPQRIPRLSLIEGNPAAGEDLPLLLPPAANGHTNGAKP